MAKKKRKRDNIVSVVTPDSPGTGPSIGMVAQPPVLPAEAGASSLVVIFALMMFLAPALGVPHEEMLQDTLKSIVVSFAALGAALVFFWEQRRRGTPLRWHAVMWLPLSLMVYALGSMLWSHTYLGGVEAIRWFIFSLLLWLGMNTLARDHLPMLAWGVHAGVFVASLWAALQFWIDWAYFPQGPHPASTFVNRNFFAEFAVCTLPFSAILLARARQSGLVTILAATTGFVIVTVLMTGTRSALIALWLQLAVVLPAIAWVCRKQLAFSAWNRSTRVLAVGVLLGTVVGLGLIPTGDAKLADEGRGINALERGFKRTGSISPDDASLGIRMIMWKATARVIAQRPFTGVGAGAWESEIPLYQADGAQLETDYYVHNEFLQLLAEYGAVGWLFLSALAVYLLAAAWRTLKCRKPGETPEAPWRAVFLCSLLALMIVSNVGFPWRMASTGALFALCLAGLAASDARLGLARSWAASALTWRPQFSQAMLAATIGAMALAAYITRQAAESESKIVRATKIALTVSASGDPNNPAWAKSKAELLQLIREGVALNPHYRKITPMVADELARWGDWKDAIWIWESVLSSRPHVVAILSNVARGYLSLGQTAKAQEVMEQARKIQPRAPAVRSLEVILLNRSGQPARALQLARESIDANIYDLDLTNAAFVLAQEAGDYPLASRAMELRMAAWPQYRVEGNIQLGNMYAARANDPDKALAAFHQALAFAPQGQRASLLAQIPPAFRERLAPSVDVPKSPAAAQRSSSKG